MRIPLIPIILVIALCAGSDFIIFKSLSRLKNKLWKYLHLVLAALLYILLIVALALPRREGDNNDLLRVMWMLFTFFSFYAPKFIYVIFNLLARLPRLWHHRDIKWLRVGGAILGVAVFFAMWWGALINRYNIQVKEVTIEIPGLPQAFDGYTIAQFSDLHTGTFGTDTAFTAKLVDHINSLGADMIVFTGDVVNRKTDEIKPHTAPLSRLHARDGVISILGNHDYGDYYTWPDDNTKRANLSQLIDINRDMGWNMLNNEFHTIYAANDSSAMLSIIGVENIGDYPFPVYGDLDKAMKGVDDKSVKILLTHNPAHWVNDIAGHNIDIPLTMSGHTHAMQIEVAGLSPAVFRYPTWGGLYTDKSNADKHLYVNIGAGTVGFPMRIGATPEITLFTLRAKPHSEL